MPSALPKSSSPRPSAIPGRVNHAWIERGSHALDRVDDQIVEASRLASRTLSDGSLIPAQRAARAVFPLEGRRALVVGLSTSSSIWAFG